MKPTELHTLFTDKEQTLLVATERARLTDLGEDELDELLTLVRRRANDFQHSEARAARCRERGQGNPRSRSGPFGDRWDHR